MPFDERLMHILLGMVIGGVLGYLTRYLQEILNNQREIKKELDEVDFIVKERLGARSRNEDGFMRHPLIADIAMLLVVGLTVVASFVSQKASHDSNQAVQSQSRVVYCSKKVLSEALDVLNERATYSSKQISANIQLQTDFSKFFNLLLHQPPFSAKKQLDAAQKYQKSLNEFVKISSKNKHKVESNPFPTDDELDLCLAQNGK